jgi:hypothetical protein
MALEERTRKSFRYHNINCCLLAKQESVKSWTNSTNTMYVLQWYLTWKIHIEIQLIFKNHLLSI